MSTDSFSSTSAETVKFDVFDGLEGEEIRAIVDATTRKTFASGATMCRQGEEGQSMYFIVSGRVQISVKQDGEPRPVILNTLGPGQHFGEMSMLNCSPRTATATAIMETEVARLDHENFQKLVNSIPGFTANLSRTLGVWLRGQLSGEKASRAIRVLGIVRRGSRHAQLGAAVAKALSGVDPSIISWSTDPALWESVNVTTHEIDSDGTDTIPGLAEQIEQHSHTIIDFEASKATPRQLLQCERIWWIVDRDEHEPTELEKIQRSINEVPALAKRLQIVEVHQRAEQIPPLLSHQLELVHPTLRIQRHGQGKFFGYRVQDIARLQHVLQGVTLGLVLGGGGARGLAHIGVIQVLEDHGLYFDRIAGTSAGSIVGCGYAATMTTSDILELINMEMTPPKWVQKLPSGKRWYLFMDFRRGRIDPKLRRYLHDYDLEQLIIPTCTVAVDLVEGNQIVSTTGDTVSSICASANHPLFGSPIMRGETALVDGGILNNVPATVLRNQGADFILTVDVGSELDPEFGKMKKDRAGSLIRKVGYMSTLLRVLDIIQRGHSKTHIAQSDFVIVPKCAAYPFEDFTKANELAEIGRTAAQESADDLVNTLKQYLTKSE
ncbi:patatin-like phospholipase family protein [Mariniblastus fucicola]|uniref:NTE family protein RssA n=1 Tax=Mariniblastus fucicola TaxID=980251 RepID=A0A5B9PRV2_9BACT|nr:cyclic nucleotide-binding and patatin-like phospholipase domain-containing protein [Mariniblastus fucicola]QEG25241.1 NTE family protein RssA [Mariniblastus fucicola]